MRRTYTLFSKWGWKHIFMDLGVLIRYIWADTIALPIKRRICAKKGHKWEKDYKDTPFVICQRCYMHKEDS